VASSDPNTRVKHIERLLEISRVMGSSLEVEELLQYLVNAACELSESSASAVMMYEEETDLLKFVAGPASQKKILKRIRLPMEKSVAGRVYTQSTPIVIQNARLDPRIYAGMEKAMGIKIQSLIGVPMIFRGETIGVIETFNKLNGVHYNEDDVTILENLASHAAVALLSTLMLEETRQAYQQLEELEKRKSDFIAISSHELRTPLGLILGHATSLRESVQDEQYRSQLDVILRSASRLKKIIDDLTNVNAVQSGTAKLKQRTVSINIIIQEITASFQETAQAKGVSLDTELPRLDLMLDCDEEKIALALNNLVENALVFIDRNGHVIVTAEKLPGYIKVSVIDSGIGIPTKDVPHVFDKFYQVESHLTRHHGGMGLGLSVAKAMIEMHDGQIWVESIEGKGSNFSFLLPARDDPSRTRPTGVSNESLSKPFG
jgi:signal transduction histidine kinase